MFPLSEVRAAGDLTERLRAGTGMYECYFIGGMACKLYTCCEGHQLLDVCYRGGTRIHSHSSVEHAFHWEEGDSLAAGASPGRRKVPIGSEKDLGTLLVVRGVSGRWNPLDWVRSIASIFT